MYPDPAPTSATVDPVTSLMASSATSGSSSLHTLGAVEPVRAQIAHRLRVAPAADRVHARRSGLLRGRRDGRPGESRATVQTCGEASLFVHRIEVSIMTESTLTPSKLWTPDEPPTSASARRVRSGSKSRRPTTRSRRCCSLRSRRSSARSSCSGSTTSARRGTWRAWCHCPKRWRRARSSSITSPSSGEMMGAFLDALGHRARERAD